MRFRLRPVSGLVALLPLACGQGGGTESSVSSLTADLSAEYAAVERCTGLDAPPPEVSYEEPRACPTSGRLCCLADMGDVPCGEAECGFNGAYVSGAAVVRLPDGCPDAFRHEAIHHLLFANGRADWGDHGATEFGCQ